MKNKTLLVMSLVAILSLGMAYMSFARNNGMVGGFGGSRSGAGGPSWSGFGGRGSFHLSGQSVNGPGRGGYAAQVRNRNRENIQHRNGVPSGAGGPAVGNQQGYNNRSQGDDNGYRYERQNGVNLRQGNRFGTIPATPAEPGAFGKAATPAAPGISAGN
jgi:hypothetical protein